ncbi:hypothetical protein DL95DRAFT_56071 [Leptodontidium sp. 2 PMI_412]|nr:hypothetical protein DL95DRAFT_56071 [Leptodontidium sp. 2 PMI_412]
MFCNNRLLYCTSMSVSVFAIYFPGYGTIRFGTVRFIFQNRSIHFPERERGWYSYRSSRFYHTKFDPSLRRFVIQFPNFRPSRTQ